MTRLAIYAHFGKTPNVAGYVPYFLKNLRSLGFEICFVSNSPISIESQSEISTLSRKFIQRENTGYDFSMWQAGLAEYDLSTLEELLLTNSSIIGPLQPLAPLWQNSSVQQCDFWGLTDNDEFGRHLQTYFVVFRRQVIQAACFMDFWRSVLPLKDKQEVIHNYEIGLTRRLEENGFKWKAVFPQEHMWSLFLSRRSFLKRIADCYYNRGFPGRNTTTVLPDLLLKSGMPFLKAALLRKAPGQVSPKIAFELLEASSLPVEILEELRLKKNPAYVVVISRIRGIIRLLSKVLRSIRNDPQFTVFSLELLPSVVAGMRFGQETSFSSLRRTQDSPPSASNPLLAYFKAHTEGPGIFKWMHYFDIYQRHFHKFVGREVHVLEVGIYGGGSLSMWREYFGENCHVYGVDIEPDCMTYSDEKTKVFIGDQADRAFWAKVKRAVPTIDILIDDGGHLAEQQRITLEEMLPHICSGGVYLCEDIHGANNEFAAYVQGLANGVNSATPTEIPNDTAAAAFNATSLQATIHSIHLYPFVTVIEKRERELDLLIALKHGTQWPQY